MVCIGGTITFTVTGVVDSGGVKRVDCSAKTWIPPATPTYTWRITKPDGTIVPPLTEPPGPGGVATVVADQPGTYSVTFKASARRECPPADLQIAPANKDTCQSGSVADVQASTCGLTVTLKEISFGDDNTVYDEASPCEFTNPSQCWGAGSPLTGVDWASVNNPDHPICYTRSTAMRLMVRMDVTGSGGGTATLQVVGPDGVTGQGTFSVPCGTEERFVSFTTSPLPNVVKAYTPAGLSWWVQAPGATAFSSIRGTSHRICVTFGTPGGSEPTDRRLNFLCYAAVQADTAVQAIDGVPSGGIGIHAALDTNPPLDGQADPNAFPPEVQSNNWFLMSGFSSDGPYGTYYYGECHDQTHLMNLMIQLLGLGAGAEYKTYASTDTIVYLKETTTASRLGYTYDLDGNGVVGDETFVLIFDFRAPPGEPHNWNNFEGSINVGPRYYAVWNSFAADSACDLYLAIVNGEAATQHWVLDFPDGSFYVHPATIGGPVSCP